MLYRTMNSVLPEKSEIGIWYKRVEFELDRFIFVAPKPMPEEEWTRLCECFLADKAFSSVKYAVFRGIPGPQGDSWRKKKSAFVATQTTEKKGAGRHSQHNERRGRQDRSVVSINAGSVHFEFGDALSLRDSPSRGLVEVLFRGFGEREAGRQWALVISKIHGRQPLRH
jgi:hypothetical protein